MQPNSFSISSASHDIIDFFKQKDEIFVRKKFIYILFSNAPAEDIKTYSTQQLAMISVSAWERIQRRTSGYHRISILHSDADRYLSTLAEPITIIEMSNDDMLFLLDS